MLILDTFFNEHMRVLGCFFSFFLGKNQTAEIAREKRLSGARVTPRDNFFLAWHHAGSLLLAVFCPRNL